MKANTKNVTGPWVKRVVAASLPVMAVSAARLTRQIQSQASLADISHTVAKDPALCLHLFRAANQRVKSKDVEILSLSHVVTALGMQGVVDVVKSAPKIAHDSLDPSLTAYFQAQINSAFAGHLVELWAEKHHQTNGERLKWANILAGAPLWALWRIASDEMRQWQWQVYVKGNHHLTVEQDVFSARLDDILRVSARKMGLPLLAQHSLERAELPDTKQWTQLTEDDFREAMDSDARLRHVWGKPETLMAITAHISQQVIIGWEHPNNVVYHVMIAHLANVPLEQAYQLNHQAAVSFSQGFKMSGQFLPVFPLLWPHTPEPPILPEPSISAPEPEQQKVFNGDTGEPVKRIVNRDVIEEMLQKFRQQVSGFENIHDILLTANKALHQGLGMNRVFVCVLNKDNSALRPYYCVGVADNSPVRKLKIDLQSNPFFKKLLARPASFKVAEHNAKQAQKMLSADVVMTLGCQDFVAQSLFAGNKPIGVVYADTRLDERRISDKEYQAFKTICQGVSYALNVFANKR